MSDSLLTPVLVTGASGFIGGWITQVLQERGILVRALYRRDNPPAHLAELAGSDIELERADLTRRTDVQRAVRDAGAVVHAAALTGDWGSRELFRTQNYDATVHLLEEARDAGCRVFVYIGSIVVHGFGPHVGTTEEGPYYPLINPYQVTKKMAERYVLAQNAHGFRTTCLRPGNVYGPRDTTMLYRLLEAQQKGIKGTLGGGRALTCPVYVTDLVEAVLLALRSERSAGEVINVTGGERVTWAEFLGGAAELLGVRPRLELPFPVARLLAWSFAGTYAALGIRSDPPLTRYRVDQLAHDFDFSIAKARRLLGYEPRVSWPEGLRRSVTAYLAGRRPGSR